MKKNDYLLYGMKGSGSAAIEAALDLCGARWQLVKAASWEPDANFEALKAVNPLGLVPTLVLPDGSVMTESAAILMHLGDAFAESGLLPRDASAGWSISLRTAMRRSASSTIPSAGAKRATRPRRNAFARARARSCIATGRSSPTRSPRSPGSAAKSRARSTCSPRPYHDGPERART
jgi:glutathione S-transferase